MSSSFNLCAFFPIVSSVTESATGLEFSWIFNGNMKLAGQTLEIQGGFKMLPNFLCYFLTFLFVLFYILVV